jgi:predicted small secreted protein
MGRVSQRLGTVAPWLRRLTAAGAVTALLLAGCTGSDNGAGGAGDDSERTAAAVEAVVDAWSALEPRDFGTATDSPRAAPYRA